MKEYDGDSMSTRVEIRALPPIGVVDIWWLRLPRAGAFEAELNGSEQKRASEFLDARARADFAATRATLRGLLASYLKVSPETIELLTGPQGKPYLNPALTDLQFNVSHSGDRAVFAVTRKWEVGVDVEAFGRRSNLLGIARRFFAPLELAAVEAAPPEKQERVFLNCWSRKEAVLKAVGAGLSIPLAAFDVVSQPGTIVLHAEVPLLTRSDWSLRDLETGGDYAAALALAGPLTEVHTYDL